MQSLSVQTGSQASAGILRLLQNHHQLQSNPCSKTAFPVEEMADSRYRRCKYQRCPDPTGNPNRQYELSVLFAEPDTDRHGHNQS